jgi:formylglycine-generating enzyme required for sulfatase activity
MMLKEALSEGPTHMVGLYGTLAVGRFEVTNQEYATFLSAMLRDGQFDQGWALTDRDDTESPLWVKMKSVFVAPGYEAHPVGGVSWRGAKAYIAWLTNETGRSYRLPTEAEWEHAARAHTTSPFYFGDDVLKVCEYGNTPDWSRLQKHPSWVVVRCTDGYSETAPVGRFKPNALGLYDTLGNVWEWVEDCWHDDYEGAPTDGSAWLTGGDCSRRVIRGGSFEHFSFAGASARFRSAANDRLKSIGLRVVREVRTK